MANLYVASTGSNTSPYDTWAKAANALLTATALAAAGDTIYCHQETETITVDTIYITATNVSIIASNDTANAPPQTLGTRTIDGSGTNGVDITLQFGAGTYAYGLIFKSGAGASVAAITICNADNMTGKFENCTFQIGGSSASSRLNVGPIINSANARVFTHDCTFIFNGSVASQFMNIGCPWESINDTITFPGTMLTNLVGNSTSSLNFPALNAVGMDLSAFTGTIFVSNTGGPRIHRLYACSLHASATVLGTMANEADTEVFLHDCAVGDVHYGFAHYSFLGFTEISTSIYVTNGATDGATNYSWYVSGSLNATFRSPYRSPYMHAFNSNIATSITPRLEILREGSATAFNNDQVWSEWTYKDTSGSVAVNHISDRRASLAAAAAQTASALGAGDWTGEGGTAWFGKLDPTAAFTPAERGYVSARVCVGGNHVVYVNPEILGLA